MVKRNNIPIYVYVILFFPVMILAYYMAGPLSVPGITFLTYTDELVKMVSKSWWKPWLFANDKTVMFLGIGLVAWVMLCYYLSYTYRNFQLNTYGDADWGDPVEITKRRSNKESKKNRILSRNTKVATDGPNAPANNNMLVIGVSGGYKTTSIVLPRILQCATNYVILDVKGELMATTGLYLQKNGYTVRSLNMVDPSKSDRYNPFVYLEKEEDVIKLVANIYDSLTPPGAAANDPFWTDGPMLYLQSLFFYEWYRAKAHGEIGNMNNVLQLLSDEMHTEEIPDGHGKKKKITTLHKKMLELSKDLGEGQHNPALRDYLKFKEGAQETVKSIIIIINAKLKLCETEQIKRVFECDEMNLREFATGVGGTVENPNNNKIALFLTADSQDTSFNFVFSMLYTQAIQILMRMANNEFRDRGGKLPIPLEFWMDEFYNGARPQDTINLMGIVRSANLSLIPILQSKAQIEDLFEGAKAEIIFDNCPVVLFLGCGTAAYETQKWISDLLGEMTVDTKTDSRNGNQGGSINYGQTGAPLMRPNAVRQMSKKDCLILIDSERPIYDRKALPWEDDEYIKIGRTKVKSPYYEAMDLNKESPSKGYVHPVEVVKDETAINGLRTIRTDQPEVEEESIAHPELDYSKKNISYQDFMNSNFDDVPDWYKIGAGANNGLTKEHILKRHRISIEYRKGWDISGTFAEVMARYENEISDEEKLLLFTALYAHVPAMLLKEMVRMPIEEMLEVLHNRGISDKQIIAIQKDLVPVYV